MTKDDRVAFSLLALVIGIGLRISPVLDVIHELMHYGFANMEGIEVLEFHWSSLTYTKASLAVIYGGYTGEFFLYGILVLCLSIGLKSAKSTKIEPGHKIAASFFLGILLVSWLGSFSSLDFNVHALKYFGNQELVTKQITVWGIWTGISMLVLLKAYFKRWE